MEINEQAPAVSRHDIVIAAPPRAVWEVHSDIDTWPSWHPGVKRANLDGPLESGSTFTWRSGPGSITSRIEVVKPNRELVWSGKSMGTKAIHVWRFESVEGGRTRVGTEESLEGFPVRLAKGYFQKMLDRTLDTWLQALKERVERGVEGSGD